MAIEAKWFNRLTRTAASVVALAVFGPAQNAVAQDSAAQAASATAATADAYNATTKTIFATYPDLDAKATVQRLAEFQKDLKTSETLKAVSDLLAQPNVKSSDLDALVLPLVEGRKIDDVDITLAAIMRAHYFDYVVNDSRNVNALFNVMEKRDNTLTESALGTKLRSRSVKKAAIIRR